MRQLTVVYDDGCAFCAACRRWLEARESWIPLRFVSSRSPIARDQFGAIDGLSRELVVIDEAGRYWVGPEAFLMCGWALTSFEWVSELAAGETMWPFARSLFRWISDHRAWLSSMTGQGACTGPHCGIVPARRPYR